MLKKIKRLWRGKKAVSPILTAILIIFITVSIAAIIFFIVTPNLRFKSKLIILNYKLEDTTNSTAVDKITLTLLNKGSSSITLTGLSVNRNNFQVNWSITTDVINPNDEVIVICKSAQLIDELKYSDLGVLVIYYGKLSVQLELKVPAHFNKYDFLFQETFDTFNQENWSISVLYTHSPVGYQNLSDWQVDTDYGGNAFLKSTSNNCQFIILNNSLYNFYDVNISVDLRTDDNDANGIIFRYNNSNTYPSFYIVWYTNEHPSPRLGPFVDERAYFNWNTDSDQIQPGKITIHYVEGNNEGFVWYKIDDISWNRELAKWYTWRIVTSGINTRLYINDNPIPIFNFIDYNITNGFIGLISFANLNAHYDNIFVW